MDDTDNRKRPKRLAREKLAALSDPLRLAMTSRLARNPASAAELSAALDVSLAQVRYQLRRMREVGLVEVVGTTGSGARENLYRAYPANFVLREEEMAGFTPEEVDRALAALVRVMFRESTNILRSAPNTEREDFVVRIPTLLDSRGWSEASALLRETLTEVLALSEESSERVGESGDEPVESLAIVLLFALAESIEEQAPIEPSGEHDLE